MLYGWQKMHEIRTNKKTIGGFERYVPASQTDTFQAFAASELFTSFTAKKQPLN